MVGNVVDWTSMEGMTKAKHTNHAEIQKEAMGTREKSDWQKKGIFFLPCFLAKTLLYQLPLTKLWLTSLALTQMGFKAFFFLKHKYTFPGDVWEWGTTSVHS